MALTVGLRIQDKLNILAGTNSTTGLNVDQSQINTTGGRAIGNNGTGMMTAQQFQPSVAYLSSVIFQKRASIGTFTGDISVSIQTTAANSPSGVNLATITINNATYTTIVPSTDYSVSLPLVLDVRQKYWIVFSSSTQDVSNFANINAATGDPYPLGTSKNFNGSVWSGDLGSDIYFKTLYGGSGGLGFLRNCECLDILNGTIGETEQKGWNTWAGTTGLRIQDAANVKAGTVGLRVQDCVNLI